MNKKIKSKSQNYLDQAEAAEKENIKNLYKIADENKENMGYWFPKIQSAHNTTKLKLPKTKIIKLNKETLYWLNSDNYRQDQINIFNQYLLKEFDDFLEKTDLPLFLKTGVFSAKFFFEYPLVTNKEKLAEHLINIHYTAFMLGIPPTNEVVLREYIKPRDNRLTIYKGMPLHTEYRVFYDFDKEDVIGVANYWNPILMEQKLTAGDLETYKKEKANIQNDFKENKGYVSKEVKALMKNVTGLTGKWSIDIMQNNTDFWLIDMARMEKSALVELIEEVKG